MVIMMLLLYDTTIKISSQVGFFRVCVCVCVSSEVRVCFKLVGVCTMCLCPAVRPVLCQTGE